MFDMAVDNQGGALEQTAFWSSEGTPKVTEKILEVAENDMFS
jgi:hypothetical protein